MRCLCTCVDWIEFRPCCFSCWARDIQWRGTHHTRQINIGCYWRARANLNWSSMYGIICEFDVVGVLLGLPLPLLALSFSLYVLVFSLSCCCYCCCCYIIHAVQWSVHFTVRVSLFHTCVYRTTLLPLALESLTCTVFNVHTRPFRTHCSPKMATQLIFIWQNYLDFLVFVWQNNCRQHF